MGLSEKSWGGGLVFVFFWVFLPPTCFFGRGFGAWVLLGFGFGALGLDEPALQGMFGYVWDLGYRVSTHALAQGRRGTQKGFRGVRLWDIGIRVQGLGFWDGLSRGFSDADFRDPCRVIRQFEISAPAA